MKKKVLFILATNKYSGAENVAITIINNMHDKFEFAYASPDGEIRKKLLQNKIKFIPMKKLSMREVNRVIKEYNPDIIHANDFRASFLSSLLKKKKKLITHIHNNVPFLSKKCINSLIFLYTSKHSNKVLTVSESIQKEYVYSHIIKNKYICMGNPVYRSKILNEVNDSDYEKKYDICCVARVTSQKNPIKFIDVISKIKNEKTNIKVIWVGGVDENMQSIVTTKLNENKLNENITFIGFKDNPFKYMAMSKVFLLTSDWEGYGLVAFEALTLGLPAVVSNVGGLINIVDDSCGLLCDKDDVSEYSTEIVKLLNDKKYYEKKSKEALNKSKKLENIDLYCERLSDVYNSLFK